MNSSYAAALGERMRAIRNQQGLSLHGVERKSRGRWKAVVIGSYERGDRAVSVQRLSDIAAFYGVPIQELLPDAQPQPTVDRPPKLVLDLTAIPRVPAGQSVGLVRFVSAIQARRGDYNGRVLTIRQEDLMCLAVVYDVAPAVLLRALLAWGVIRNDAVVVRGA